MPYNLAPRCAPFSVQASAVKESTHEASSQDFRPDVWNSGHLCSGRRSAGSHPGRRADFRVPTSTTTARQMRCPATDDEVVVNRLRR